MEYSIIAQNAWKNAFNEADQDTLFNDGHRKIDMVLAYEDSDNEDIEDPELEHKSVPPSRAATAVGQHELVYRRKARKIFERNLELSGLHLERESKMDAFDRKTSFVKIHVPKSVVDRNADILGLTAPVKEFMVTAYMSTTRNVRLFYFGIIFGTKYQQKAKKSTKQTGIRIA